MGVLWQNFEDRSHGHAFQWRHQSIGAYVLVPRKFPRIRYIGSVLSNKRNVNSWQDFELEGDVDKCTRFKDVVAGQRVPTIFCPPGHVILGSAVPWTCVPGISCPLDTCSWDQLSPGHVFLGSAVPLGLLVLVQIIPPRTWCPPEYSGHNMYYVHSYSMFTCQWSN